MARFFVRSRGLIISIDFYKNEAGRVILLLDDIETRDARLFDAFAGVGQRETFEIFDTLSLHVNVDVDDKHGR